MNNKELLLSTNDPQASDILQGISQLTIIISQATKGLLNRYILSERSIHILIRLATGLRYRSELVEYFKVPPSVISFDVDRLEREGFIRRIEDPNDKRRVILQLTKKGERISKKILDAVIEVMSHKLKSIKKEERTIFIRCLLQLAA